MQNTLKLSNMKKIFTFIFSMGLLTAAFAQDGHRRDNNRDNVIVNPSYGYQSGNHDRGANRSYGTTPFKNSNAWDSQLTRDHDSKGGKDFRFNDDRRDWSYRDRHDDRIFQKHMRNRHSRKHYTASNGFQISIGIGR
jgi:hypothetical protein